MRGTRPHGRPAVQSADVRVRQPKCRPVPHGGREIAARRLGTRRIPSTRLSVDAFGESKPIFMNLYSHFPGKCKPLLCVITGVLREKRKEVRALLCFLFSGTEVHVIRFGRDSSLNVTLCLVVSTLVFACNFYVVPCGGLAVLQTIGAACRDSEGSI